MENLDEKYISTIFDIVNQEYQVEEVEIADFDNYTNDSVNLFR